MAGGPEFRVIERQQIVQEEHRLDVGAAPQPREMRAPLQRVLGDVEIDGVLRRPRGRDRLEAADAGAARQFPPPRRSSGRGVGAAPGAPSEEAAAVCAKPAIAAGRAAASAVSARVNHGLKLARRQQARPAQPVVDGAGERGRARKRAREHQIDAIDARRRVDLGAMREMSEIV